MKIFFAAFILFSLLPLSAEAGHPHGCSCRVCQQLIAQPLLTQQVAVPYYYSVGQPLREEAVAQRAAQLALSAITEDFADKASELTLKKLQERHPAMFQVGPSTAAPPTQTAPPTLAQPSTVPATVAQPRGAVQQAPGSPPANVSTQPPVMGGDVAAQAQAIFNRSCVMCHSPTTRNIEPDLSNISVKVPGNPWKVWGLTHAGTMPKRPPSYTEQQFQDLQVSDNEVDLIRNWALGLDQ